MKMISMRLCAALMLMFVMLAHAETAIKSPTVPDSGKTLKAGEFATSDFFRAYALRSAHLSPDGRLVAMVTYPDKKDEYVTIVDLATLRSVDVVQTSSNNESFGAPRWVADDTIIFYDYTYDGPRLLISLRWDGFKDKKPQTHITTWPEGVSFVDVAEGDHAAYVSSSKGDDGDDGLYRVNINAGESEFVSANKVMDVAQDEFGLKVDRKGLLRLAARQDDDGAKHFLWRRSEQGKWLEYRTVRGDEFFWPIGFTADDKHILAVSDAGRDTRALKELDLETGKFTRTLVSDPHADVTSYVGDWRSHAVTGVVLYRDGVEHFRMLDSDNLPQLPALHKAFKDQSITPVDRSRDGGKLLVFVSSDRTPGAYYVFDAQNSHAQLIGELADWLPQDKMAHVQAHTLKTDDGLVISYLLALPVNRKGPFPLVVVPHGGPHEVFDTADFDPETQLLANRGFAVLKVNYRGSGGAGKHLLDAGKHQWGEGIESDITAAVKKVLATAPIDPRRVCIFGGSYGGYSALMGIIKHPELYRCGISFAGVTDVALLASGIVGRNHLLEKEFAEYIGDPNRDMAHFRSISPVYLAAKISRPIFIAQGLDDERVDPEQAYRMRAVLEKLHKDVEFKAYPGEGHGFRLLSDRVDFYDRLVDFMRRKMSPSTDKNTKIASP